jgi:hypothetical protein
MYCSFDYALILDCSLTLYKYAGSNKYGVVIVVVVVGYGYVWWKVMVFFFA